MSEEQAEEIGVTKQPQQNRCETCGAVFRSIEELERHRSECQQKVYRLKP